MKQGATISDDSTDLDYYERGETSYFAMRSDPRFGYCLYVPRDFRLDDAARYDLAVLVHGSARTPQVYRSLFSDFAESERCIVLAPMFPSRIFVDGTETNYKFIKSGDIRFDLLLLEMVDEVVARYQLDRKPFLMHGFSGGGHFAHRFYYLHPTQLMAVSIGAPGMVTLFDDQLDWHCGTRGMEREFGQHLSVQAMRRVPVQMVIGSLDTDTREITIMAGDPLWMPRVNDAGRTRLDRLNSLRTSLESAGIAVRFDVVPDVAHDGYKLLAPVKDFFANELNAFRSETANDTGTN